MGDKLESKRIVFTDKNRIEIKEFIVRKPKAREIVVENVSSLISAGTEVALLTGTHIGFTDKSIGYPPYPFYPMEPGFCSAGKVIAMGSEVKDFKQGDNVVVQTGHASHSICRVDPMIVQKIPDNVSFDQATFTFLGMIGIFGVVGGQVSLGKSVLIMGQGIVGQLSLQLAKLGGANPVIVIDLYNDRLDISRTYGADYALNAKEVNVEKEIHKITKGEGVNIVIEATGNSKVIPLALKIASKLGKIMVLGSPREKVELNLYTELHRKGLSLMGAHGVLFPMQKESHFTWTTPGSKNYVLELLSKDLLKVDGLITHKVSFKEAAQMYEKLRSSPQGMLGVILDWTVLH